MKREIYYFTGTGNSLHVARTLAHELDDATLIPIARLGQEPVRTSADCIGMVFPVYMWGLPLIVERFARSLVPTGAPYIFAVATYGGAMGDTLRVLKQVLAQHGIPMSSGFGVQMPTNYTPLCGAIPDAKQQKLFTTAKEKISAIAATVRTARTVRVETGNWLSCIVLTRLLRPRMAGRIPLMDREFRIEESRVPDNLCATCKLCARLCPVSNIEMNNGRPEWLHHCEQCLSCLQWCPAAAIQIGEKTLNRKRYRHPAVTKEDMLGQAGPRP